VSGPVLGITFTAENRDLQAAVESGKRAFSELGAAAKRGNEGAERSARQYTEQLRKQADTLGMTRAQTLAYESSQHKLTEAQRQSVQASIAAIDAYDRKVAMLGRVRITAAAAGTALGVALVSSLKASVAAAAESEQAQLRLEAVLRGTGYASGFTGDQLDKMASRMQSRLGISDETIKKSMAILLTFKQVGRESFEPALEMAANLSALTGNDLASSMIQLGKAMEHPEQGLTALTRSGVSFTAAQKNMIKEMVETGRQAEAITMILHVMKSQGLDGVAEAMNKGLRGASNDLKNSWDDLLEALGKTETVGGTAAGVMASLAKYLKDARNVVESGDWLDKLAFFTVGYSTFNVVKMRETGAPDYGGERSVVSTSNQNRRAAQEALDAQEKARQFMSQFMTDNEKLEAELRKWTALANQANLTTAQRAQGEARIRSKFAKQTDNQGAQLITQLQNELAQLTGDGNEYDALVRKLTDGTMKLTAAQTAEVLALKGQIVEIKRASEARKNYLQLAEEDARIEEEIRQINVNASKAQAEANVAMYEAIERVKLETELMGLSNAERERRIALLELEKKKNVLDPNEYQRYREQLNEVYSAKAAAEKRKEMLEEQKRFNDELARGLTDSIFRGFEGGKSFARNFFDSLKNMAKTTILQPVVKFLVSPITSAVGATLGGLGIPGLGNAASLSGGGGLFNAGIGDLLNPVLSAGGLFSSAGAYSTALGLSSSAAGSQAALLAAQTREFGLAGLGATASSAGAVGASAISTALPYVGIALAAASMLGAFGGSKGGPASWTGYDVEGLVSKQGFQGDFYGTSRNSKTGFRWQQAPDIYGPGSASQVYESFNSVVGALFETMEKLGSSLGLDTGKLSGFSGTVAFSGGAMVGQGLPEFTAQFTQALSGISDEIALTLMPRLRQFAQANESATQTLVRLVQVQEQLRVAEARQTQALAGAVRGLPGQLGITSLESARNALAVSDYQSPLSRLGAARSLLEDTYQRGMGGDLTAVSSFGSVLQQALTIGRDVGASGPEFQALFLEGNRQLNELLAKQQGIQAEILRDVDVSVIEASQNQIAELKKQFAEQNAILNEILAEQRRLREAA
jgi:hypothetical protein